MKRAIVRIARTRLLAFGACVAQAAFAPPADAHDQSFSYAALRWDRDRVAVTVSVHRDDAASLLGWAQPESLGDPDVLRREAPRLAAIVSDAIRLRGDGAPLGLRFDGADPRLHDNAVSLAYATPLSRPVARLEVKSTLLSQVPDHETFLRVVEGDRLLSQDVLTSAHTRSEVYRSGAAGTFAVFVTYVRAGIHHIFIGPDHILFIVGLLLLGGRIPRVLRVATAFTLAHSLTLGAASLGLVSVPGRIVEPLIAASIVYVGVENLRWRRGAPDWRTRIAFCFGLIHGFGFAGVLKEVGLTREALGWSLLAFNLGVEIGQACIVLTVTPLLSALRRGWPRLAPRAVAAGSWAIILAGGFWFLQRIAGL